MGAAFVDYFEIGEHPFSVYEEGESPGREIAEYRYRLNRARRRAARERLETLKRTVEDLLARVTAQVDPNSTEPFDGPEVDQLNAAVREIERLVGDSVERRGRWADLRRHLRFGQGHDWHDIAEVDWPSIRSDVEAAGTSDSDPLSVLDIDLGAAAGGRLSGKATLALAWSRLDDEGFERLLFDLLRSYSDHDNVQWLTQTRAPDRGRDLSLDRRIVDSTGGVRVERVIVQARHWQSRSVGPTDVANVLTAVQLWEPPTVHALVIATSGRFMSDAVAWAERHDQLGQLPMIELWPENRLEELLAERPHLAAAHGLR
jgi:hypothetical protein